MVEAQGGVLPLALLASAFEASRLKAVVQGHSDACRSCSAAQAAAAVWGEQALAFFSPSACCACFAASAALLNRQ